MHTEKFRQMRTVLTTPCRNAEKVLVVTGYPDSEILDRILQVSPVTVLKKPLMVEQLNQAVKLVVHNGPNWRAEQESSKLLVGL